MHTTYRLILLVFISFFNVIAFGMEADSRKSKRHSESFEPSKRQRYDHDSQNILEQSNEFTKRREKLEYFDNFRTQMERKFSYWGKPLTNILDKISALYLDNPSDKPGVFILASMPGSGKNTFVKHIRDFLEDDPSNQTHNTNRFQLIKDRSKPILDPELLKNTGSSQRLKEGIHRVVVIDEIQSMTKDYGYNNTNYLWFQALGDAEVNIDITAFIKAKMTSICNLVKNHLINVTSIQSFETQISHLKDAKEINEAEIRSLISKKNDIEESMRTAHRQLALELRELKSNIPSFFMDEESKMSSDELVNSIYKYDDIVLENRFKNLLNYKTLYFDRNIYIFLGNPTEINDDVIEEFEHSPTKNPDVLRELAEKKLNEKEIKSWFINLALSNYSYTHNKRGWDSRLPNIYTILPPASKHFDSLITASIEFYFCNQGSVTINEEALKFFKHQLGECPRDLRSISSCYTPFLTDMFNKIELLMDSFHKPQFILEKSQDNLSLMVASNKEVSVTRALEQEKKNTIINQTTKPSKSDNTVNKDKEALYSAYFYTLYYALFNSFPHELHRIDDAKFDKFYNDISFDFILSKELNLLTLNLFIKHIGSIYFPGEIDQLYNHNRTIKNITNITEYLNNLKTRYSKSEIHYNITNSLGSLHKTLGNFYFTSEIFHYLNSVVIDPVCEITMGDESTGTDQKSNEPLSIDKISDTIHDSIICSNKFTNEMIASIETILKTFPSSQNIINGLKQEFSKSSKLVVTFKASGEPDTITAQ